MFNWRRKLISITVIAIMIIMLCLLGVNGNGQVRGNTNTFEPGKVYNQEEETIEEEVEEEVPEAEPVITNLDVTLIDNVNENTLKLRNCTLVLDGKLVIVEDVFDYSNTFILGDIYEITITVNLKEEVKERIELLKENK